MTEAVLNLHRHLCGNPLLRFHLRVWMWIVVAFSLLALYAIGAHCAQA